MITLKEIARQCDVSVTTVSNILNGKPKVSEETRQRVLQVVRETGYQPNYIAQGLRRQRTQTIAILAEDVAQFTSPGMIESIMEYCEQKGFRTIVQNLRLYGRWQDKWYDMDRDYHSVLDPMIQELLSFKVDGVIYLAGHARIIHCFPENFQIPAVMAYAYTGSKKVPSVVIDDERSSHEMTRYLLSMGHRRIGVIGGRADNLHTQKRLVGFQKALFEEKVLFDPQLIRYGNWNRETGFQEAEELIKDGVTAIYAMSDLMAAGVYDCIRKHGLQVGRDISVAGFDNQEFSDFLWPALTTTALPLSMIGHEAARILLEKIEKGMSADEQEGKVTEIAIPCTMMVRNSVCAVGEGVRQENC